MMVIWIKSGKPDVSMTLNGALAGLVAITPVCVVFSSLVPCFIVQIAGLVVVLLCSVFFDFVVKIVDSGWCVVSVGSGLWSSWYTSCRCIRRGSLCRGRIKRPFYGGG
jgi:ammonia channel protein AmtB